MVPVPPRFISYAGNAGGVGVLIGALEATGEATDFVGEQLERNDLANPFANPGISFFAVAKGAGAITEFTNKKVRSVLGFSAAEAAVDKAAKTLGLWDKAGKLGKTLFKEGKLLTWLPEAAYHMRVGYTIANVFDRVAGDEIEKRFGKNVRSRLHTLAFFLPELAGKGANKFFARLLAKSSVLGPAAEFYAALEGLRFSIDISTKTLDYLFLGQQVLYDAYIAIEAYKERPKNPAIDFIFGEDNAAFFCGGRETKGLLFDFLFRPNPFRPVPFADVLEDTYNLFHLSSFVDAVEGFEVFWGLKARDASCRYWREKIAEYNNENAKEELADIKDQLRVKLASDGLDAYGKIPCEMWEAAYNSGFFNRVDSLYLGGSEDVALARSIINISFTQTGSVVKKYFSYDFLKDEDKMLEKGLMPNEPVVRKGQIGELVKWVGGEGRILSMRRQLFYHRLIEATANIASGEIREDDLKILELARKAGFIANGKVVRLEEYYIELSRSLTDAVRNGNDAEMEKLQAYAQSSRAQFKKTGEYAYLTDLMILHPDVIFRGDPKKRQDYNEVLTAQAGGLKMQGNLVSATRRISHDFQENVDDAFVEYLSMQDILGDDGYDDLITGVKYYTDAEDFGIELAKDDGDPLLDRRLIYEMHMLKIYGEFVFDHEPGILGICRERPISCGEEAKDVQTLRGCHGADVEKMVRETRGFGLEPYYKKKWREKMKGASNAVLLDIQSQMSRLWAGMISLSALDGSDPAKKIAERLANPENIKLRKKVVRAAAYWKVLERPTDKFWRTFVSGAFTEDGQIGNVEALHAWVSEALPKVLDENIKTREEIVARKQRVLAALKELNYEKGKIQMLEPLVKDEKLLADIKQEEANRGGLPIFAGNMWNNILKKDIGDLEIQINALKAEKGRLAQ